MKQLSKHLSFANVMSCIAVFAALSGAAYAATTAARNSVKASSIARGAVTTQKLRNGAVTNAKLRNGAVTGSKVANATIGSSQLANGAVRSNQLGGGVVTEGKLKDGAVSEAKLKNSAVTGPKIANGAVGSNELGANAVSTAKLQDGAVSQAKLSSSLFASLVRNVTYVTKTSASNFSEKAKSATAECPTGKQTVGGGARVVGSVTTVAIVESAPVVSSEKRTGWAATARDIPETAGSNWAVEAFAVCAEL